MAIVLLALAFTAGLDTLSNADTSGTTPVAPDRTEQTKLLDNRTAVGTIQATLFIEIPESRLIFRHVLEVAGGTTASGLAAVAYKVDRGLVCCDSRDVKGINGLMVDPYQEKWWTVRINGNMQNSSPRTVLNDGDKVEWRYEESQAYQTAHVRLEEWVARK